MSEVALALALALGSSKVKMGLATARATVSICGAAAAASPSSIAKPLHPRSHCHFLPTSLFSSFQDTAGSKVSCSLLNVESVIDDDACELVSGEELSLEDGDDNVHAYLFKAVKNNNGIGLLLLSDVYGFEDSSTRDFAYRVACNGFNILLPDLFRGNPWTKDQPNTQFEQWITGHNPERIAKDITAWTEWLADEFMTEGVSRKLGIIGFCFGGGKVLEVLAQDQDACFGTGISFYGTRIDSLVASDVKVPVLFILGDNDPICAVSEIKNIQTTIDSGSKVVIFPGRGHGFAHRPESVEEDKDAEQAYVIMRDWIHEHLV
ncbi:dienelactone hydrolase family protein [Medicago truncatula]|uniref:Carboxymethylenebutenolidase homolog n=1 Tax=Medicago truncatula TaxID=3880 RepID=G7IYB3_MEDTR|nr:dienelactone hydrolase family protein [Medicago truncatula]